MRKNEKQAHNIIRLAVIAIILALAIFFVVLFFNCIHLYGKLDAERLDFAPQSLTFEKYEQRHNRGGWYYLIHFKEYPDPLKINTVVSGGMNKTNLNLLRENDVVEVTFCRDFDNICEMRCGGMMVLRLSDYIKVNRNNQIIGMITCLVLLLCSLFLAWIFLRTSVPSPKRIGSAKPSIKYTVHGNVIQIYYLKDVCYLVINDQVFDQHRGLYSSCFCLKGIIGSMKAGGKTIHVEAKMGLLHMRLYCNGQLVAKKFMLFG